MTLRSAKHRTFGQDAAAEKNCPARSAGSAVSFSTIFCKIFEKTIDFGTGRRVILHRYGVWVKAYFI